MVISKNVLAVLAFFALSPLITWLNKYTLTSSTWKDNFLLVFYHQLTAFVGNALLVERAETAAKTPRAAPSWSSLKCVAASAVLFALQLGLSNYCLQSTALPVYQAARATSLIFSLALEDSISLQQAIGTFGVGVGFLITVFDEPLASIRRLNVLSARFWLAVFAGLGASASGVGYMHMNRHLLRDSRLTPGESVKYVSFAVALFCSSLLFVGPPANIPPPVGDRRLLTFLGGAVLSPAIPLCTAVALQTLTPLTCTLLGIAKSTVQTAVGALIFGHPLTHQTMCGVTVCLLASTVYSFPTFSPVSSTKDKTRKLKPS